jgi:hypothetical protein
MKNSLEIAGFFDPETDRIEVTKHDDSSAMIRLGNIVLFFNTQKELEHFLDKLMLLHHDECKCFTCAMETDKQQELNWQAADANSEWNPGGIVD